MSELQKCMEFIKEDKIIVRETWTSKKFKEDNCKKSNGMNKSESEVQCKSIKQLHSIIFNQFDR